MTVFRALDHYFQVSTESPGLTDTLQDLLEPLALHSDSGPADDPREATDYRITGLAARSDARLLVDDACVLEAVRPDQAVGQLLREINLQAARTAGANRVVLHAGAVHDPEGAIVFPQGSMAGKSTLVAGPAQRGWSYIADDLTTIEPNSRSVDGLARAISLRRGSWDLFADGLLEVDPSVQRFLPDRRFFLPAGCQRPGITLSDIVVYFFDADGPGDATLTPLDPVAALRHLLGASFSLKHHPQRDLDTLASVVERSRTWEIRASSLTSACDAIARLRANPDGAASPERGHLR